jgi:hypothetical protein
VRHRVVAGFGAGLSPTAALAECTGGGCYDGLGLLIGGAIVLGLVVVGLVITLIVLLFKRRFGGAKIVAGCLAVIALGVLGML